MTKWVYNFGGGAAEGDTSMKNLLGGKGANLAEMASLGRSGARASMPGMMDTVLNLGLNDETVEGLAKLSGDSVFRCGAGRTSPHL